jgi:hypothetical protein
MAARLFNMGKAIAFRYCGFTGPTVGWSAGLHSDDGINMLFGASNTGKSFVVKEAKGRQLERMRHTTKRQPLAYLPKAVSAGSNSGRRGVA